MPLKLNNSDPLPYGDGIAGGEDLIGFISEPGMVNCSGCRYVLDANGDVDVADLFLFSEDYGRTP